MYISKPLLSLIVIVVIGCGLASMLVINNKNDKLAKQAKEIMHLSKENENQVQYAEMATVSTVRCENKLEKLKEKLLDCRDSLPSTSD